MAAGRTKGPLVARLSPNSQSQVQVDDGYLIALAKQGDHDVLRPPRAPLLRLRPPEGLVVLPRRRRQRRPHPGGARRPLQGDPRLPLRPRVELPQLRRALHHAPDHHGGEDGDAQQAHAAEPVRLVLEHAGERAPTASRRSTRSSRARRSTTPSTRSSPPRSCARSSACLSTALSELESRVLALYLDGYSYEQVGERIGCDTQDGRQRAAARQAQGRGAPRRAQRAAVIRRS